MVKLPPRSQGRMPPQGSPFAAFSGTPSAPFAKYGTKAAQTMIGSHNIHRPIVFFVFVAISSSPISRERNATGIARPNFFPRCGPLASMMMISMQGSAFELLRAHLTIVSRLRSTLTALADGACPMCATQTQAIWLPEWGPTGECSNCSPGIACNQAS